MPTLMFLNLPVEDLARSVAFYEALGYSTDPNFTGDESACVVISETIYVMLVVRPYFQTYVSTEVADATKVTEAMFGLGVDSREDVDTLVDKALAAGGSAAREPRDLGFMYNRTFLDPDGHYWDVFWMDPTAAQQGPPTE
ncbi:VOC family protein [Actinopolymorpha singaporensis]|uniref:VOC domain-containing protein n=1 Tax=Actinopolymorpha singaporensis TaxID=117157 RepID=A0A1H1VXM9_9ACTN|nr:VOC family protein [Actinopolymorpha singaporensis]SDS89495.1 hypothetical protein SAMN04489717_4254 [Actinopolymorpha singaporensis]